MGDFSGLQTGLSALHAARKGLDVTGHNIANVNTDGYSRQRVDLQAEGGASIPSFFSKSVGVGQGVRAGDTYRLRDAFLEARGLQEHGSDSMVRATQRAYQRIEGTFAEPSANGLQSQLSELWSSFDEVTNRPSDLAARTQVLERAQTLVSGINQAASDLQALHAADLEQLTAHVAQANTTASRIAELNDAIRAGVNAGTTPNDLMDQRDQLVGELASSLGATTRETTPGVLDVYINGTALVRGNATSVLAVTTNATTTAVVWQAGGADAQVASGTVAGVLDAMNNVIPGALSQLNGVAAALATTANTIHQSGYDLNGAAGLALFTTTPGNEARSIAVNSALVGQPARLAASGSATPVGNLDGSIAAALAEAGSASAGPDTVYRSMIDGLGVAAQRANRRVEIQAQITSTIDGAREAESGVNLDEEMTQMLAFQHAYDAAARFVTAIDSALDTLIHSTGLVGR